MELVTDVENTVRFGAKNSERFADPYEPNNKLVMVGTLNVSKDDHDIFTYHHNVVKEYDDPKDLQAQLDKTTLLIAHNAVHDLVWLWESGFVYDGPVFDTMLAQYLLNKGNREGVSLAACCEKHELTYQKSDFMKAQLNMGINVDDMDYDTLCDYLEDDLRSTRELYHVLKKLLADEGMTQLHRDTCETAKVVAEINRNGLKIDADKLEEVKHEYIKEQNALAGEIKELVSHFVGDTPINLNSSDDLSKLLYSRELTCSKDEWEHKFNDRMPKVDFNQALSKNTAIIYRTNMEQCTACKGEGKTYPNTKKGVPRKNGLICKTCYGKGYILHKTDKIAGMMFSPLDATWVRHAGFVTDGDALERLEATAKMKGLDKHVKLLQSIRRTNQISTYVNTFVAGYSTYTKWHDGILHANLTQHVAATGRFSSVKPNMQNQPRGNTFPVKKCVVSRWEGGEILEADWAQLEFRAAAYLSQDPIAIQEIRTGFDVHSYTASVITAAGQTTNRQEAKPHTFAPLYGATGYGRTSAEASYYEGFIKKYQGMADWHTRLGQEVLSTKRKEITLPSGRKYAFPQAYRRRDGKPTYFTKIKNYPVQGFATADIVPLAMRHASRLLKEGGYKSLLALQVHDSLLFDVYPGEREDIIALVKHIDDNLIGWINEHWGIDFNVPLLLECKIGPNWMETKDV